MLFSLPDCATSVRRVVSILVVQMLKSVTQSAMTEFENEYRPYAEKIFERNRSRVLIRQIKAASTPSCIDSVLVQNLCTLGQTSQVSMLQEGTVLEMKEWFDKRLAVLPRDMAKTVFSAINFAHYEQCPEYLAGAALSFVLNRAVPLGRKQASEIMHDKSTCASLIPKLATRLHLPQLLETIGDAQKEWNKKQKADLA